MMASGAGTTIAHGHGHVVKIYDDERDFASSVVEFLAAGIADDDLVLVVATPRHRRAIEDAAREISVDVPAATAAGQLVVLDAQDSLATFMVDGTPDAVRFDEVFGRLVRDGAPRGVRIFGEMVAVLWDEGNVGAAIALEQLWNDLGRDVPFSLYCSYAMATFGRVGDLGAIRDVCDHHAEVVGPRDDAGDDGSRRDPTDEVEVSELFMPVPLAIRSTRRLVAHTLRAWGEEAMLDDALIVASELATNAVLHAASPFRVSLTRCEAGVTVSVSDAGRGAAELRQAEPEAASGRGLALIERLSRRWGTERVRDGKIVWAQFDRAVV
jgi:anti-sigma regulatory factor (Ser/Thr protein kinase)